MIIHQLYTDCQLNIYELRQYILVMCFSSEARFKPKNIEFNDNTFVWGVFSGPKFYKI
jgi:hypothetical protein